MKKNMLIKVVLLCVILSTVLIFSPFRDSTNGAYAAEKWPEHLSIGTTSVGGSWYLMGTAIANLTKKYAGIPAGPQATGGGGANMALLSKGEMEMAVITTPELYEACRGIGIYTNSGKAPIRLLWGGHLMLEVMVTRADSGIKTPRDFPGKRLMFELPAGHTHSLFGKAVMEVYGLTEKDVTWQLFGSGAEGVAAMKEGVTDVWCYPSAITPISPFRDLASAIKPFYISVGEKEMKKLLKKYPSFQEYNSPPGVWGDGSIRTAAWSSPIVCRQNLPVDFVYKVMKAVWDHVDELVAYYPSFKQYTLENAVKNPQCPFHPGAVKYYKEKGIWTEELAATQNRLVREVGSEK